jgi:hypothetical protein
MHKHNLLVALHIALTPEIQMCVTMLMGLKLYLELLLLNTYIVTDYLRTLLIKWEVSL